MLPLSDRSQIILELVARMAELQMIYTRPQIIFDWSTGKVVEISTIWINQEAKQHFENLKVMLSDQEFIICSACEPDAQQEHYKLPTADSIFWKFRSKR